MIDLGKARKTEGHGRTVSMRRVFFHGRPIQRSLSLRSPTQSQCLCDPNRKENIENSTDVCEFSGFTGTKSGHIEPTGHLMRVLSVPLVIVEFL